jgi:microcystin-dependent protein
MAIVGEIVAFGGSSTPAGYLYCDGAAVRSTEYYDLYTAIGTTYGAGTGSNGYNFNLPDLRGRSPLGIGGGADLSLGETGGALTAAHDHGVGTIAVAAHTHDAGTLEVDAHAHGAGTLADAGHTHGAGSLAAASHVHELSDAGQAQVRLDSLTTQIREVTSDAWTGNAAPISLSVGGGAEGSQGAGLMGETDGASASVSGTSASGTASLGGSTASASPGLSGSTASGGGGTGTGSTASASPSVLHPVLGLRFLIYAGA